MSRLSLPSTPSRMQYPPFGSPAGTTSSSPLRIGSPAPCTRCGTPPAPGCAGGAQGILAQPRRHPGCRCRADLRHVRLPVRGAAWQSCRQRWRLPHRCRLAAQRPPTAGMRSGGMRWDGQGLQRQQQPPPQQQQGHCNLHMVCWAPHGPRQLYNNHRGAPETAACRSRPRSVGSGPPLAAMRRRLHERAEPLAEAPPPARSPHRLPGTWAACLQLMQPQSHVPAVAAAVAAAAAGVGACRAVPRWRSALATKLAATCGARGAQGRVESCTAVH